MRVVIEGDVRSVNTIGTDFVVGYNRFLSDDEHVVSVEKVEPPVVTFKPGQLIRGLENGLYYTLMPNGYLVWGSAGEGFWQPGDTDREFTSELFDLVEID